MKVAWVTEKRPRLIQESHQERVLTLTHLNICRNAFKIEIDNILVNKSTTTSIVKKTMVGVEIRIKLKLALKSRANKVNKCQFSNSRSAAPP